jgi:hypothetical protein
MPTRSYSGGATSLKKSPFHRDIFSFITLLSPFIAILSVQYKNQYVTS